MIWRGGLRWRWSIGFVREWLGVWGVGGELWVEEVWREL